MHSFAGGVFTDAECARHFAVGTAFHVVKNYGNAILFGQREEGFIQKWNERRPDRFAFAHERRKIARELLALFTAIFGAQAGATLVDGRRVKPAGKSRIGAKGGGLCGKS